MSTKIIKLEAANVKRLKAVTIEPNGNAVVIGGRNAQGKSSVIDAIEMALGGATSIPAEPIRRGAESARVVLELDDLIVKRTFTASGSRLEVSTKDGAVHKSPQTVLDKLVGSLSFDPLKFTRMDAKEQVSTLRQLAGVDFSTLDAQRKAAFDKRTEVSREVKRLGALLASAPVVADAPAAEVSISELANMLAFRREENAKRAKSIEILEDFRRDAIATKAKIAKLEAELAEARAFLEETTTDGKKQAEYVALLQEHNEAEVVEKMRTAEELNGKVRQAKAHAALSDELFQRTAEEGHLTAYIKEVDETKRKLLEQAKFNVPGLTFDDDTGVRLNGVPFEQASGAEQLRASVAIGLAANPTLKVLLIREGSLLDEDGLSAIAKQAAEAGAQLWVERVSSTGEGCSVVIEDGAVRDVAPTEDSAQASAFRLEAQH